MYIAAIVVAGHVTRDNLQQQILVQHSVAMLEQCRNYSNIVELEIVVANPLD